MVEYIHNEANAVATWLRQNGINPVDVSAWPSVGSYIGFDVEFEDTDEESAEEQRERLGEFIKDTNRMSGGADDRAIMEKHLLMAMDLHPPEGECRHQVCDDPAEMYFFFPSIGAFKLYCEEHTNGAAKTFGMFRSREPEAVPQTNLRSPSKISKMVL